MSASSGKEKVKAYTFSEKGSKVSLIDIDQVPFEETMVEVEITVTSLCHTDLSVGLNEWKSTQYPIAAGHEGVGKVVRVGKSVKSLKIGSRVALGWLRDSCGGCRRCLQGQEPQCFGTGDQAAAGYALIFTGPGTFASHVRVHQKFAYPVPDGLSSIDAAPMLCAGITVFGPLRKYVEDGSQSRVGIVGLGGLGHLGVKFASVLGFERVYAISRTEKKKDAALKMGATHYIATNNADDIKQHKRQLDVILYTAPGGNPVDLFPLLRCGGALVHLGAPPVDSPNARVDLDVNMMIFNNLRYIASGSGGSVHTNEMLALASRYNITSDGEVRHISELNEALNIMVNEPSKMPFRFIFKTDAYSDDFDGGQS
eukprot:CAMPEP_0201552014 /NCGR_PEP_ID=MMETSP0173_2-20130828/12200_1 /ASSEMBLY_ACC=CAM_ASM_000268 /TAXON_ID=218659 /ORGANISM="Vexillifera sp., Strain DIVA3 564/2" /LENGTH=368 /DNA_ID=CAMNT_0047962405 /DNA_START=27 /DNA_END=1133 /DNA_ORIENTATION=+